MKCVSHIVALPLLLCNCSGKAFPSNRDTIPLLEWKIALSKREALLNYIYKNYFNNDHNPALVKRFYCTPKVLNKNGFGLYYISDFTHKGPMYVISSSDTVTVVVLGATRKDSQDSITISLAKHHNQFDTKTSRRILQHLIK